MCSASQLLASSLQTANKRVCSELSVCIAFWSYRVEWELYYWQPAGHAKLWRAPTGVSKSGEFHSLVALEFCKKFNGVEAVFQCIRSWTTTYNTKVTEMFVLDSLPWALLREAQTTNISYKFYIVSWLLPVPIVVQVLLQKIILEL